MSLPKISHPIISVEVPSTKKTYRFRPFLVKEEKILLMAKSSEEPTDILAAIKQVINNCALDPLFYVNQIAIFDLEYIFLKLRAASIDNSIKVSYRDAEDQKIYDFEVDLDKVAMVFPAAADANNKIAISKTAGIVLNYPPASLYDDKKFLDTGESEIMFELISRCIAQVYDGDKVYLAKDYKPEEMMEFVENLDVKTYAAIDNFLKNAPKMEHVLKYTNSLGTAKTISLTTLSDFFTLR